MTVLGIKSLLFFGLYGLPAKFRTLFLSCLLIARDAMSRHQALLLNEN